ncbi:MAG: O-antigen ligase family protein [Pseudomonadota bacterium]
MLSETTLKRYGTGFFLLFSFTIFVAKAPINISSGLLLLTTLIFLYRCPGSREIFRYYYVRVCLFPLILGLVLSFFSLEGPLAFIGFLHRYRFFFLVVPFALFITEYRHLEKLFRLMNVAACLDVVYCMLNSDFSDMFSHFYGYHKFGRNSDMLFSICLFNLLYLIGLVLLKQFNQNRRINILLSLNTALLFVGVVLLGERGAWIGFYFGLFIFLMIYSRKLLFLIVVISLMAPFYTPDVAMQRLKSIVDVTHFSNDIRLRLYRAGFDYLVETNRFVTGTGVENVQKEVDVFFETKPKAYQDEYYQTFKDHPGNFHNSFLQMAVEGGVLFLLSYLLAMGLLLVRLARKARDMKDGDRLIIKAIVSVSAGFLLSQFFHEELFRYGGLVFMILLYAGCYIEKSNSDDLVRGI